MNSYQKLKLESLQKDKRISELYVVIDTLQTNLRSAVSCLGEKEKKEVETPSFKWSMKWKAGDEKE
jgi:type II secretory pathway component PulJ|tara:strand:+ start:549 stop:746 length:198 start_codon:yes stop_codon:yes gene_type:complete